MNFALVPAAGRSSRLGRPKALVTLGKRTVLDRLLDTLADAGIDEAVVIAAPGEERLVELCKRRGSSVAVNERVADGMLSSVLCGLRSLNARLDDTDTLTICPVDFPILKAETVTKLISTVANSERGLAVPSFDGRRGHPLVLSSEIAGDVEGLDPTVGLRGLLDRLPYEIVEVTDPGVRSDLDTWIDYARLSNAL